MIKTTGSRPFLFFFTLYKMPYKHDENNNKQLVKFEYPCFICSYIMSKPKVVIDHVRRIHGYEIPTRHVGYKRPPNSEYDYQNDPKGDFDVLHYSCASCWFHCPETGIEEIHEHVETTHKPKNVDPSKNSGEYVRADVMETDELVSSGQEEEVTAATTKKRPLKLKGRDDGTADASDIMGKLNELTDLFKSLLK
jgi:hypothetical protein